MAPDAWTALASVVLALAAVAAAVAAFLGLRTWKNQSIWNADNELARRILVAVYWYRDSLFAVRHPSMSNSEMQLDQEAKNGLTDDQIRRDGVVHAYAKRWERHSTYRNDLDALLLESDAVWGSELSELMAPLKELAHELYVVVFLHLDAHYRGDSELAKEYQKILKSKRDILYDLMTDDDVYRIDFANGMAPLEDYLKLKLGRH